MPDLLGAWANELCPRFNMFDAARSLLLEFGGLSFSVVSYRISNMLRGRSPRVIHKAVFVVDPSRASDLHTRSKQAYEAVIQEGVCPIGTLSVGASVVLVGESKKIYIDCGDVYLAGLAFVSALPVLLSETVFSDAIQIADFGCRTIL